MPIVAVVSIFNGSMDIDTEKLNKSITETSNQFANLCSISLLVLYRLLIADKIFK